MALLSKAGSRREGFHDARSLLRILERLEDGKGRGDAGEITIKPTDLMSMALGNWAARRHRQAS